MTFHELWETVKTANPSLSSGKVTMSTENFRKALQYAYNKAQEDSRSSGYFEELFRGFNKH